MAVGVVTGFGEWDPRARTFHPGSEIALPLDLRQSKVIYLGREESRPLNFDFYPSDLECSVRDHSGSPRGVRPADERRLVNFWHRHWAVGTVTAEQSGTHSIACQEQAGRTNYSLVLASPSRYTTGLWSPMIGTVMSILLFFVAALLWIISGRRGRLSTERQH